MHSGLSNGSVDLTRYDSVTVNRKLFQSKKCLYIEKLILLELEKTFVG